MPTKPYVNKAGLAVPSVTTIISSNCGWGKDNLMRWSWRLGCQGINYEDKTKEANDAGTLAHYLIECDIRGISPDEDSDEFNIPLDLVERARKAYSNYEKWRDINRFEGLYTELSLVSEQYGFAGTIDCIGIVDNECCIVDWKSSKKSYSTHKIQVGGYSLLANENGVSKAPINACHILRVDKFKKSFTHEYIGDLGVYQEAFLLFLKIHKIHDIVGD